MKSFSVVAWSLLVSSVAFAAELPTVPAESIAEKGEVLFSDDFAGSVRPKEWHRVVPTFEFVDGALKGTQTRDVTIPAQNGKPEQRAHAAVHGLEVPTSDSVVECRIKFDGATMIDVEFTDRKYAGSHYGHICRAQVRPDKVTLIDERDGNMKSEIYAIKNDPARKAEVAKLLVGRSATFPLKTKLETDRWYDLVVETVGDEMRVVLDGKPVGYLKSSGIAHATKSKIELGVAGKSGWIDDVRVSAARRR
ncbi:MAG: hypothetical protein JNL96_07410 [Planctomycetaceae bacterium]|nr:hypothetical protein [Planctomycetaceae bacterium]